jgi:hypothetical protein
MHSFIDMYGHMEGHKIIQARMVNTLGNIAEIADTEAHPMYRLQANIWWANQAIGMPLQKSLEISITSADLIKLQEMAAGRGHCDE